MSDNYKNYRHAARCLLAISILLLIGVLSSLTEAVQVIATIPVESAGPIAVNPATNRAVVTNGNGTVTILNLATNSEITRISVGTGPFGVAINPVTNRAVVTHVGDLFVSVIDLTSNTVLPSIPLGGPSLDVAINANTNQAVVTMSNGTVKILDLSANAVIATISVAGRSVDINPTTNHAVIAGGSSGTPASILNLATNSITSTIPLPVGASASGHTVAINPNTNRAVVTLIDSVVVLDLVSNTVAATIPTSSRGNGIAINPVTNMAVVDNLNNKAVQLLDLSSNSIVETISVSNSPHSIAINPNTNRAYVVSSGPSAVTVIDLTTAPPPPPALPHLDSLSPPSGPPGTIVAIAGSHFGGSQEASTVAFGGTIATDVRSWGTTAIQVVMPSLPPGTVNVTVSTGAGSSNSLPFQVTSLQPPPVINSVVPDSGVAGSEVTIQGSNFGSTQGSSSITFGPENSPATVRSWTNTSIRVVVPTLSPGPKTISVTTAAGTSNGYPFTVVAAPVITSIEPAEGPSGSQITIRGFNFQNTPGTLTIGGIAAAFSHWANATIVATVPTGLSPGSTNVIVTTSAGPSAPFVFQISGSPTITLSTNLIQLSAVTGDAPKQASLTISNTGSGTLTWSTQVSPSGSWLTVTPIGGTAPSTVTVIATVAPLSPGSYQGTITFFGVGATNSGIAVTVNLTVLGPGSISIGAPSSGQVGVPVTITVTGVVNACANISLDFGDNSPQVPLSNTGGSVQHTYSTRGTYTIRAHPSNCTGTPPGIATFTIEILPTGQALSSIAAAPSPAQVGQQVTFTISGQGSCNSVQVNFDDGTSTFLGGALPLQTAHAYAMSGSFTVTATGTGCTQQDNSVTTTLTVNPVGLTTVNLTILVRNANTLAPIANASVNISGPTPRSGVTDASGLVLFNAITAGNYTVTASAPGYSQSSHNIAAIGAPSIQDEIRLTPTGPQTGILNVATTPVNGDIFVNGMLYGAGSIRREVPVGSYTVSFGAVSGYTTPASQSVNITAGQETVIVVTYKRIVLPKANLLSPSDNATGVSITPTFIWSGAEGANLYWLMVAKDPSHFPTDTNATSCPNCVISGRTGLTSYAVPHTFPVEGRSRTLDVNATYYWKVQAWNTNGARGDYSDAFRFTTEAPESKPAQRVEPSVNKTSAPTAAPKAVVITHGYWSNASNSDLEQLSWVAEMAENFCKRLGFNGSLEQVEKDTATKVCQVNYNDNNDNNDWDVWVYDWRTATSPFSRLLFGAVMVKLPQAVFDLAPQHGDALFDILKKENYQHIHFVAHSAGSNLIEITTRWLKNSVKRGERSAISIHETFLDAFHPDKDTEWYGPRADWADNYVDTRPLFWGVDDEGTKLILKYAYNIDVTPARDTCGNGDNDTICFHSRPYRFYGVSINMNYMKDTDYMKSDPIGITAGMGYLLSVENGRSVDENDLKKHYPPGGECKVLEGTCNKASPPPSRPRTLFAVNTQVEVDNKAGTVRTEDGTGAYLYNSLELGQGGVAVTSSVPQQTLAVRESATPSAATEPPSYLVVNVTTISPVNTLRFNWSFQTAGEGLLRVFVGGNLVRQIDQRHVTPSSLETEEIYIGGVGEPLPAGTHRITFRLDGFGANASGAELTDVELGLKAGPPTISTTALPTGEVGASYAYNLLAEGGMPPYTWSLAGGKKNKLSQGLTLTSDGILTGTPAKAKTTSFTVQVRDAAGASATRSLSLQIVKGVKFKTKLGKGKVGTPYSATLQATGGILPLAFSLIGSALPPGLTLDPATGHISGTPTAAGTFNFQARVASSGGSSDQKSMRITIK